MYTHLLPRISRSHFRKAATLSARIFNAFTFLLNPGSLFSLNETKMNGKKEIRAIIGKIKKISGIFIHYGNIQLVSMSIHLTQKVKIKIWNKISMVNTFIDYIKESRLQNIFNYLKPLYRFSDTTLMLNHCKLIQVVLVN